MKQAAGSIRSLIGRSVLCSASHDVEWPEVEVAREVIVRDLAVRRRSCVRRSARASCWSSVSLRRSASTGPESTRQRRRPPRSRPRRGRCRCRPARSMPRSAASRRASGDAGTRAPVAAMGRWQQRSVGGAVRMPATPRPTGRPVGPVLVTVSAAACRRWFEAGRSGCRHRRSSPTSTRNSSTMPSCQISMSMSDFSVSTTATTSPRWTVSPTRDAPLDDAPFVHVGAERRQCVLERRARVDVGHRCGADQVASAGDDVVDLRDRGSLEVLRVGDRHLGSGEAGNRRVERPEARLGDRCSDLGAEAAGAPALVDDERTMGAFDRLGERGQVERAQRPQIDDLGRDAAVGELRGGVRSPWAPCPPRR